MNQPNTVERSRLTTANMLDGNEYVYPTVIDKGRLLQWMSIGWVDVGEPSATDIARYPHIVEDKT